MLSRMRSVAGALFIAVLGSAACSEDPPKSSDDPPMGGEGGASSGSGGKSSGSSGKGGKGGSSSKAGSTGQSGDGNDAGSGGTGGAGPQCPACASGFCLEDGTCVDCLASDDQCPLGSFCSAEHECVPGCKMDALSCASGKCNEERNCDQCIDDLECIGEDVVCNEGTCGPACTAEQEGSQAGCGDGLTCCSLHCIAVETNSNHCGACGTVCDSGQFCGNTSCVGGGEGGVGGQGGAPGVSAACVQCFDTALSSLCAIGKVVVILDTTKNASDGNRKPGREIGAAIGTSCATSPTVVEEEQDSVDALNFTTGRPVSGGGELLLVAGGVFFQNLQAYVEAEGISPLYLFVDQENDLQEYRLRSDDSVVVGRSISADNLHHDYFIVQFMRDAASGSLVLNVQGFWLSGTTAASFLMQTEVLPNLEDYDQAWYAYEWTDVDDDGLPSLPEIDLVDSGS